MITLAKPSPPPIAEKVQNIVYDFMQKVKDMRDAQKAYCVNKTTSALSLANKKEIAVDQELRNFFSTFKDTPAPAAGHLLTGPGK